VTRSTIDKFRYIEIIFSSPKNLLKPTKKPRLSGLALAFQNPEPGQSRHEVVFTAWLGLAWLTASGRANHNTHYKSI
jgi:hypothetical protein